DEADEVAEDDDAYEEEYEILYTLSSGDTVSYQGTAEARVVETNLPDREEVLERLRERLQDLDIPDTDVRESERGVTISLEDIQFPPESDELLPSETAKLDRIIELLSEYPDADLLITGHTALAGTPEGRRRLSEARAASVGNYLLEMGVRSRDQLIIRGVGAEEPLAPNTTEAGRRRNRRVEFTILQD
ncbi:MAG: OmpA family protein, partial [bacterium]